MRYNLSVFALAIFAVCFVSFLALNLSSIAEEQRDSLITTLYDTDDIIDQVAHKLDTESETITFELGDRGELFYHTLTGTYVAKVDGSSVEYLLEVNN